MTAQPQPPQAPPPRLLAVDPGEQRTGLAVSDDLGLYAHTRPAIIARGDDAIVEAVAMAALREGAAEVIVGLPLSLAGGDTAGARHARLLAAAIARRTGLPVRCWDERLSSVEAARGLAARRHRTGELDSRSAAVILQAALDERWRRTP